MNNVYVKIKKFDESTNQIIFSCASDFTLYDDPDKYEDVYFSVSHVFQCINSKEQFLLSLFRSALGICEERFRNESKGLRDELIKEIKNLEGCTFTLNEKDIHNNVECDIIQEV